MRDGKEVGFAGGHDPAKRKGFSGWTMCREKVVMWNWNFGILGPYLA
jgi:hypothetical protein